jgi:hypothetical protein
LQQQEEFKRTNDLLDQARAPLQQIFSLKQLAVGGDKKAQSIVGTPSFQQTEQKAIQMYEAALQQAGRSGGASAVEAQVQREAVLQAAEARAKTQAAAAKAGAEAGAKLPAQKELAGFKQAIKPPPSDPPTQAKILAPILKKVEKGGLESLTPGERDVIDIVQSLDPIKKLIRGAIEDSGRKRPAGSPAASVKGGSKAAEAPPPPAGFEFDKKGVFKGQDGFFYKSLTDPRVRKFRPIR